MTHCITFLPSTEIYVAAAKLCFRHQVNAPKFRTRLLILVTGAMILSSVVVVVTGGNAIEAITAAGVGVLWGLGFLAIIIGGNYLLLPRRSRRLFAQDKAIAQPTRFTWDAEQVCWQSDAGSFRTPWQDIYGWAQNDAVIIFFANERLYRFVPASALSDKQREDVVARVEPERAQL